MRQRGEQGFSLLEMMVAISILAMSLGALYQAVGGATKSIRVDEKYLYAVELGRSLLALNSVVERESEQSGETQGGFTWRVVSTAHPLEELQALKPGDLQDIVVEVAWNDASKRRSVVLNSVVAGGVER